MNKFLIVATSTIITIFTGEVAQAAAFTNITISQFTGGDIGEGLDLDGNFEYAVNLRGPAVGLVRDANFTADNVPGVTVDAQFEILQWGARNYGNTSNDNNLEIVMESLRFSAAPNDVTVDLANLTIGNKYKGQLLFVEQGWDRGFNVLAENTILAPDFSPLILQGGAPASTNTGVVISFEFTAMDETLNILLDQASSIFPDENPIIQGLTLEEIENIESVPEPSIVVGLLILGGIALGTSKKKQS